MPTDPAFEGRVQPRIALALLETLRQVDTPGEALEHEAFSYSLPRRLGLSDVIARQIDRYEELRDRGQPLPAAEFADLVRLLGRREDAAELFAATGRTLARERLDGRFVVARFGARLLPGRARRRRLVRAGARIARATNPAGIVATEIEPPELVIDRCLLARAGGSDAACALLGAALEECADTYARAAKRVRHVRCEARGEDRCVWRVEADGGS